MPLPMSIEMGSYPFVQEFDLEESEEFVETGSGRVKINIYGEKSKHPIITFHDIGMSASNNFDNFFQYQSFTEIAKRFCVYNINAPGQEIDAKKLPYNYVYPTMDGLARIVEKVVAHFGFKSFIGLGVGAGANVFLRYALSNQKFLDALILVNATSQKAGWIEWFYQKWNLAYLRAEKMTQFTVDYLMWHHFGRHLEDCNPDIVQQYRSYFYSIQNLWNLALYIESFLSRTEVPLRDENSTTDFLIDVPVLQVVGANSAFISESVYVNSKLNPKNTEWLKVSDSCGLVLDDKPKDVTRAFLLFLQGVGFCTDVNVAELINAIKDGHAGIVKRSNVRSRSYIENSDELN